MGTFLPPLRHMAWQAGTRTHHGLPCLHSLWWTCPDIPRFYFFALHLSPCWTSTLNTSRWEQCSWNVDWGCIRSHAHTSLVAIDKSSFKGLPCFSGPGSKTVYRHPDERGLFDERRSLWLGVSTWRMRQIRELLILSMISWWGNRYCTHCQI